MRRSDQNFAGLGLVIVIITVTLLLAPVSVQAQDSQVLWKHNTEFIGDVSVSSSGEFVALTEGHTYSPDRTLILLKRDGTDLWTLVSELFSHPLGVSPNGTNLCIGYGNGLASFDGSGRIRWNVTLWQNGNGWAFTAAAGDNGECLTVTEPFSNGILTHWFLQFDAQGRLLKNSSLSGPGDFEYFRTASISEKWNYIALTTGGSAGSYQVHLFDRAGNRIWSNNPGGGSLDAVFVTNNASFVAAGTGENEVYLYNRLGELLWTQKVSGPVLAISISPDQKSVIVGSRDGYVYFYAMNGELLRKAQFASHYGALPIALSEDGLYVAAGLYQSNASLYGINGTEIWSRETSGGLQSYWVPSISYKSQYIALSSGRDIWFFDRQGDILWQRSLDSDIGGLLISSTGNYLAARSGNMTYLINKYGQVLWSYSTPQGWTPPSISNDGEYVAVGYDALDLVNRNGTVAWRYQTNGTIDSISQFSSRGDIAVASTGLWPSHTVYMFDKHGTLLWSRDLYGHVLSISADGDAVAVGSNDGVYVFDRSGKLLWNFTQQSFLIEGISSTVDGGYVAALGMNTSYYRGGPETLYFFDKQGKVLWSKEGVGLPFSFSADKASIMGSVAYVPHVFDKNGNQIWSPPSGPEQPAYAVISSDGEYIAAATVTDKLVFIRTEAESKVTAPTSGIWGFAAILLVAVGASALILLTLVLRRVARKR